MSLMVEMERFLEMAHGALPHISRENFSVSVYYQADGVRYGARAKNPITGTYYYFNSTSANYRKMGASMAEAVELMKLAVAEWVHPDQRVRKVRKQVDPGSRWARKGALLSDRDEKMDFMVLQTTFNEQGPMQYKKLIRHIRWDFKASLKVAREYKKHWESRGILIKIGNDRAPGTMYVLGSLPGDGVVGPIVQLKSQSSIIQPENRDKKEDFDVLYTIFNDVDTMKYKALVDICMEYFELSQRSVRMCISYWIKIGLVDKVGVDRSASAGYKLGKLPE